MLLLVAEQPREAPAQDRGTQGESRRENCNRSRSRGIFILWKVGFQNCFHLSRSAAVLHLCRGWWLGGGHPDHADPRSARTIGRLPPLHQLLISTKTPRHGGSWQPWGKNSHLLVSFCLDFFSLYEKYPKKTSFECQSPPQDLEESLQSGLYLPFVGKAQRIWRFITYQVSSTGLTPNHKTSFTYPLIWSTVSNWGQPTNLYLGRRLDVLGVPVPLLSVGQL